MYEQVKSDSRIGVKLCFFMFFFVGGWLPYFWIYSDIIHAFDHNSLHYQSFQGPISFGLSNNLHTRVAMLWPPWTLNLYIWKGKPSRVGCQKETGTFAWLGTFLCKKKSKDHVILEYVLKHSKWPSSQYSSGFCMFCHLGVLFFSPRISEKNWNPSRMPWWSHPLCRCRMARVNPTFCSWSSKSCQRSRWDGSCTWSGLVEAAFFSGPVEG